MNTQNLVRKYCTFASKSLFFKRCQSTMTEKTPVIKSFKKSSRSLEISREYLENLSREELVDRCFKLEAHNHQLKNIIWKKNNENDEKFVSRKTFNFDKVSKRHVFLKLYYLGWDYSGFVTQENTTETVENYLFNSLVKCCLIESKEKSNYQLCGRTDKGVSAYSQVVSLDLRSKFKIPDETNVNEELPYCSMLNRTLPKSIRCYAWCHIGSTTSARFQCSSRTYKYYFPKGNLNVKVMQKGADYLIGVHDFRNFCKMDVKNAVTNFVREISHIEIRPHDTNANLSSGYEMLELIIKGKSFLWHQIRCIMSILLLIGQEKESPDIVKELLNIDENPRKPQYAPASEFPLNLYDVDYQGIPTKWNMDHADLSKTTRILLSQWTDNSIKCVILREIIENLRKLSPDPIDIESLIESLRSEKNKPLMERMKCESLDNRISHFIKKRRIEAVEVEDSFQIT